MKLIYLALFLAGVAVGPGFVQTSAEPPKPKLTSSFQVAAMQNVEVDVVGTGVLKPDLGKIQTQELDIIWQEDRYLIGWAPWIGYGKGSVLESHFILMHNGVQLFVRGPHKENSSVMYDCANPSEFFPDGTGRLVRAGEKVTMQFLVLNTGSQPGQIGGQANARVFSLKAQ